MMTIVLCGLIGLAWYLLKRDRARPLKYYKFEMTLSLAAGAVVGLFCAFLIGITATYYHKYGEWELRCLNNTQGIHGEFFLGCGRVDGDIQDYFYYKTGNSYRGASVSIGEAEVFESDTIRTPYIEEYEKYSDDNVWKIDGIIEDCHFIFHVPTGSIANNYSLGH